MEFWEATSGIQETAGGRWLPARTSGEGGWHSRGRVHSTSGCSGLRLLPSQPPPRTHPRAPHQMATHQPRTWIGNKARNKPSQAPRHNLPRRPDPLDFPDPPSLCCRHVKPLVPATRWPRQDAVDCGTPRLRERLGTRVVEVRQPAVRRMAGRKKRKRPETWIKFPAPRASCVLHSTLGNARARRAYGLRMYLRNTGDLTSCSSNAVWG